MKITVLGAGLVGAPMAIDLAKDKNFDVCVVDLNEDNLNKIENSNSITKIQKDLSIKENVREVIKGSNIIVNAVPGFLGFNTLKTIIDSGINVVDIAFFPEDPFVLDDIARDKGVTVIMDCGVAPGMSNILVGYIDTILDKTESVLIYVGGLPEIRKWPYEYTAVFSPIDVIEEYTRPARYVENSKIVIRPALSDPEYIDFPGVGTLEAFNSDGLRTLATTINAPNMKEKTLRYPGHIEKIAVLRETGFFSKEEIEINNLKIRPLDFTAKLLFPRWKLKEGEADITVMKVIVEGEKDGQKLRYTYDLFDRYDAETKTHSMARTTGYTATTAVRMIAEKIFSEPGVIAPEFIGGNLDCVEFMLNGLKERGVEYVAHIEQIGI